jgi:preprotein translocase subunit SecB
MADENQQPVFQIQRVYLKDLSLEQPNSPAVFLEQQAPTIEVAVDVGAAQVGDGVFESTVTITVTAKVADKVAFLVEGKQAGIFEARNIADIITRAGFPPVHLSEINFEAFYQQRLQALAEQQNQAGASH